MGFQELLRYRGSATVSVAVDLKDKNRASSWNIIPTKKPVRVVTRQQSMKKASGAAHYRLGHSLLRQPLAKKHIARMNSRCPKL